MHYKVIQTTINSILGHVSIKLEQQTSHDKNNTWGYKSTKNKNKNTCACNKKVKHALNKKQSPTHVQSTKNKTKYKYNIYNKKYKHNM